MVLSSSTLQIAHLYVGKKKIVENDKCPGETLCGGLDINYVYVGIQYDKYPIFN